MRFLKKMVLRASRVFTHHQVAFNKAILAALDESIARAEQLAADASTRLELGLRQAYADRHEGVASLRFDLVAVQQQLVSLQQTIAPLIPAQTGTAADPSQARRRPASHTPDPVGPSLPGRHRVSTSSATGPPPPASPKQPDGSPSPCTMPVSI